MKDFQNVHEGIGLDPERNHIDMSTCTFKFELLYEIRFSITMLGPMVMV